MGQEWGCRQPFFYFCDFNEDLAVKVREGRRKEFNGFPAFRKNNGFVKLPDPCGVETFKKCVLDWNQLQTEEADRWLTLHRKLLEIRHKYIIPRLSPESIHGSYEEPAAWIIRVEWQLTDSSLLVMYGDFGKRPISFSLPGNICLYCSSRAEITDNKLELKPWSTAFFLQEEA
jgi:1,4-alpha-glucan branching enzyme